MCYYRGITIKNQDTLKINDVEKDLSQYDLQALVADGFNYGTTPVIVPKADCGWDIVQMEWGFLPHYLPNREAVEKFRRGYTDDKGKFHPPLTTLNAIGEELLLPNKMYRNAALRRRCLFISTCFYEWRHVYPLGKKGQPLKTPIKYPYQVRVKGEKDIHLVAGIWQTWTDKETGETIDTCSLVTTKANKLMEQIHNSKKRMPVILTDELAAEWISDDLTEERIAEIATFQYPAEQMEAWPIHKDFKNAHDPSEPFAYEDLPGLDDEPLIKPVTNQIGLGF
ncbi:SOS response-associated peptidase [Aridibaculum aurantiacum]|uniref:SOS response-associated peptidase n=1 Tax=Aridibaculum aurantiacum TaxID=2810307 RepID=UPI001A9641EA|nr:SOS response-associated peptidase family protein [Aridibaculum aurantiacum]